MGNINEISDKFDKGSIPIIVGITGHRDIDNEQELISHIKNILLEISGKYQASPILLLTPLAEGADRAAAKAVNELKKTDELNMDYVTLLPMREEEYIGTFLNKQSIDEYIDLKSQAVGCYKVPISGTLGIDKIQDIEIRHSKLYANMGAYIALNTQILIGAWNGAEEQTLTHCSNKDEKRKLNKDLYKTCVSDGARCPNVEIKHGGTYHIFRIRFFGVEDEYRGNESYLTNREFGPVYWIKTKRKSSDYLEEGQSVVGPTYPDFPIDYSKCELNSSEANTENECEKIVKNYFYNQDKQIISANKNRTYEEILLKLNDYNVDINKLYPDLIKEIELSQKDFITYSYIENEETKKEVFSFANQENNLIKTYAMADVLSFRYQKNRKNDIVLLLAFAFLGLLAFNLYSGPLPYNWFILSYSAIYLFGSLLYVFNIRRNRYHERYIDYRGIAEALRVQFFWNLVGVKTRVTDKYLTKQKSSIDWIRIAVNNAMLLSTTRDEEREDVIKYKENILTTYKLWLLSQYNYYNRKCPQKNRTDLLQQKTEKILFVLGLTLAILLAGLDTNELIIAGTCGFNKMFLPLISNSNYEEIHKWLVFAVGFLPVIIACFKIFTELLAYSKLARNFKWMRMVYSIALHEFKRLKNNHDSDVEVFVDKSRKLFYDIGIEALLENGEWIWIFEERAPELPK